MFEILNEIKSAMLKWLDGHFKDLMRNIMSAISYSIINGSNSSLMSLSR